MIALAVAVPLQWAAFDRDFRYKVSETTKYAHSEKSRDGVVRVVVKATSHGWTDVEATTTWNDAARNKENVWIKQNQANGEIYCLWVKGTERAHTFNPPLLVWGGEGGSLVRMTPTFRPFGHHALVGGKSQGYEAPAMGVERLQDAVAFGGETTWNGGDKYTPIEYRLKGEFAARTIDANEPGFKGRGVERLRWVNSGSEVLSSKTGPNESVLSETTWSTFDLRWD